MAEFSKPVILTLIPGVAFLMISLLLQLLLPGKHCIVENRVCHEKMSYKLGRRWQQYGLTFDKNSVYSQ